ncbi:MAG TPA: FeoC-like transcriptional regulator [Usitatibacter sp.]|nr:FeoC-like transcriptional regulator [Usitatibacter sp.]
MLRRLLDLVGSRGTARAADLAPELGVSAALVESMLGELARQGYLRPLSRDEDACTGCAANAGCISCSRTRVWALVELKRST